MDDVTTTSDEEPVQDPGPSEQGMGQDAIDEITAADTVEPALEAMTEADGESAIVVSEREEKPEPEPEEEPESEAEPEPEEEPEAEPESQPTLDDLIADLAVEDTPSNEGEAPIEGESDATPGSDASVVPRALPEVTEASGAAEPLLQQLWTHVPFWIVGGAWLVLTACMTIMLWSAPAIGFRSGLPYAFLILGGAAFAVIDLVTGLVIWRMARARATEDERRGLALTIWNRALLWIAGGVALWWIGLFLLDLHHVVGIG
jgi:hypothetical protein